MERVFRTAALSLAREYLFARQFVNTGRMAVANPYTRSSACMYPQRPEGGGERTPGGGQPGAALAAGGLSVQNAAFLWADNSAGVVNDLLQWANGELLLLVFGELSAAATQRLQVLSRTAPLRCVQVIGPDGGAQAHEHVIDPKGHLQAACHVFGHAWALVRPDGYLAATGEQVDGTLVLAIEKSLGLR